MTARWDVVALMRAAQGVYDRSPELGGWRSQGGEVLLVLVAGDGRVRLGPTWYLTPGGHAWASPRWGSYPRRIQGNAARSLAVLDALTGGEVLAGAARAGVCGSILDVARELRAQGVLSRVRPLARVEVQTAWTDGGTVGGTNNGSNNNSGSPSRKDTSPWACALAARSGEDNTQTVQG
jgi:hypothetical protein